MILRRTSYPNQDPFALPPLDWPSLSISIQQCIDHLVDETHVTQGILDQFQVDLSQLTSKKLKKQLDLERGEQRMKTMHQVRPAYMDQYEKFEIDLIKVYAMYTEKHRNLSYLEHQVEEHMRWELHQLEVSRGGSFEMEIQRERREGW
ncbi:Clusterin-associated protein 1 [Coelomomyces lativittatus]|nr:Clusterin-associated protein 1 [Coelomomyces lativittatus]